MSDKMKLPRVVATREAPDAPHYHPTSVGWCHPENTGRYVVAIEVPEHIHPLIGVEGGAMWKGERVTVLGPHPAEECSLVCVRLPSGDFVWRDPDNITPAPKTRTVTLEVDAGVNPRRLNVTERGNEPYPLVRKVRYRIISIDGQDVDDE